MANFVPSGRVRLTVRPSESPASAPAAMLLMMPAEDTPSPEEAKSTDAAPKSRPRLMPSRTRPKAVSYTHLEDGTAGTDGTWDEAGVDGVDGIGGLVWAGTVSINPQQSFSVQIGDNSVFGQYKMCIRDRENTEAPSA